MGHLLKLVSSSNGVPFQIFSRILLRNSFYQLRNMVSDEIWAHLPTRKHYKPGEYGAPHAYLLRPPSSGLARYAQDPAVVDLESPAHEGEDAWESWHSVKFAGSAGWNGAGNQGRRSHQLETELAASKIVLRELAETPLASVDWPSWFTCGHRLVYYHRENADSTEGSPIDYDKLAAIVLLERALSS
ncbi:hypothetical protein HPB47_000609 [Ixodes persulcatus]|uniref:Uncharacterized protein n=1 Tax=Ixodes persulcatus TaxID=34615 RepID=A0AC60PST9_IXOPE|nr:hypothetical protein HPB47_000609 [Ixodes persulcatus]